MSLISKGSLRETALGGNMEYTSQEIRAGFDLYLDMILKINEIKPFPPTIESFTNFMGVENLPAATRSFHTAGPSDKFIRIGGSNNRVLDPGILDSGLGLTPADREKILDIFEATTGGRLIQNYNTIGGVQADIVPDFAKKVSLFKVNSSNLF